jgi:hypothetical protein
MKLCKLAGLFLLSTVFSSQLAAQEVVVVPADEDMGTWEFRGALINNAFDQEKSYLEGIDDSAFSLLVAGDYIQSGYRTTVFLEMFMYDDKYGFSQWVEGDGWFNDGDVSQQSSDASGVSVGLVFGPQWTFGADNQAVAYVQGGFNAMLSSERGISSCSNCYSEDIELKGGALVQAGVERNVGSFTLGLVARSHVSGDLGSSFGVTIGSGF